MGRPTLPSTNRTVKISLIRLSGKFPTAGMRKSSRSRTNQQLQSHVQGIAGYRSCPRADGRAAGFSVPRGSRGVAVRRVLIHP